MQSALVGSWHNNGFYGHYRGQFKSESAREYRLAAKPQPPAVFLQRCQGHDDCAPTAAPCHGLPHRLFPQHPTDCRLPSLQRGSQPSHTHSLPAVRKPTSLEPAQQHFFSKHDNRTSFDKGIGRRKDLERLGQRHTFLRWAPCELELHQRPLESSYQSDFRSGPGLGVLPQRLVHFVQVRPARASTTYQQNFCQTSWGSRYSSDKVGPEAPVTSSLPDLLGPPRPKLLQHYLHAGVSECLNWSRALKKNG